MTQREKGAFQLKITELQTDLSRLQDRLLEKKNEIENVKLQQVARSVSPSRPSSPTEVKEAKGKEKAVEEPVASQTTLAQQPQPEAPVQQPQQEAQQDERVHGSFERTFRFPQRIDASNVSASFKDSALRITVPRAQVQQVRRIAIL